jgi:hypothetical protein
MRRASATRRVHDPFIGEVEIMKKIRLELDAIEVESFPTDSISEEKGTVEGHLASRIGDTWCITCGEYTCWDYTCNEEWC